MARLSCSPSRSTRMPVHLRPSAPTAPTALLCGDPARALAIAQHVLMKPRMSNHHRGLWGYHGETAAGLELTVQATGIGGPSAAIVIEELAALGLRRAIRVGTCTALAGGPAAGAGVVVGSAIAADGTSAALGIQAGSEVLPDFELTTMLSGALAVEAVRILSRDLPPAAGEQQLDVEQGRLSPAPEVGDLQTAAVLASTRRRGIRAAALLAVASSGGRRLEDEPLEARLLSLAGVAVAIVDGLPESL